MRDSRGRFVSASGSGADGSSLAGIAGMLQGLGESASAVHNPLLKIADDLEKLKRAGGGALGGINDGVDKLIGKRAALRDAVGGQFGNILGAMQQMGGPLASVAGKVQNIASLFGRVPPHIAAAIIAARLLVAAVQMVAGTVERLGEAAIEVVQKLSMMRSVLGAIHGAAAGNGIVGMVDKLSRQLPFASDQIAGWAKSLSMVARNGVQLESMVKAVAAAQALMGESGAAAAQQLIETLGRGGAAAAALVMKLKSGTPEAREELNRLGLKTIDLANALGMTEAQFKRARLSADQMNEAIQKALQKKGAGPLGEMALTWPVIIQKAKEGVLSLFDKLGPAVKPFMAAVKALFGEFSKGGSVINALKPIVTSVMSTLFAWGTKAVQTIREIVVWFMSSGKAGGVFSGVVSVLRAGWGALVAIWNAARNTLKPYIEDIKAIFKNAQVLQGLRAIFTVMAAVVMGAVVAFGALVAVGAIVVAVVGRIVGAIVGAVAWIAGLGSAAVSAGSSIIDGLLGGLDAGAFVSKMADMARSGLAAFKGVLGIASPSKVMLEHGEENIAGAAATGIDKGRGKVKAAAGRMGADAVPDGAGGGKGGPAFTFNNCDFSGTSEGAIRRMMARIFEEMAGEAGADPQGAT